jgi:hypothetical protein
VHRQGNNTVLRVFERPQASRASAFFSSRAKPTAQHVVLDIICSTICRTSTIKFCQVIEKRRSYEFPVTIKRAACCLALSAYLLINAKVRGAVLPPLQPATSFLGVIPCGRPPEGVNRLNFKPIECRALRPTVIPLKRGI